MKFKNVGYPSEDEPGSSAPLFSENSNGAENTCPVESSTGMRQLDDDCNDGSDTLSEDLCAIEPNSDMSELMRNVQTFQPSFADLCAIQPNSDMSELMRNV